ncbi:PAS domain S-box protein [Microvirga lotononidis]|uniref:Blue-light-activated histidine kinase n=1 Tax=Microvirga lotononidis TaxID=864069 RepID=I4YS17_9HYPH|nr:PAS domain S-box protein [Microvirga lotononidis]EIM26759.1 PAS domain S-box [Microvirga lotononidis]WQO31669.1 PAS domain S-box protein [Microvirga lotononidis]
MNRARTTILADIDRTDSPPGTGEMAGRIRTHDWAATPLGPLETWPQSLRSAVDLILPNGLPMIVLWGPELIQIYNEGYARIMGLKHPAGLGQPTRDCWPEVWHINEPIYERVRAGETVTFDDALYPLSRSGVLEDVWFTLSYSPLRDDSGVIAGVLVTLFETTARHVAQRQRDEAAGALQMSEERLRRVLETDAVGVLLFNHEGTLIDANEVFLRKTGWAREDIESGHLDWRRMTPAEWVAVSEAQMDVLRQTGHLGPYEKEYLYKDGRRSWMLFAGRDLGDGTIVEFAVDISARKEAEQAEQRLAAIIESSDDAIISKDLDGVITSWNRGAERLFGYQAEEVIGRPITILIPEDRQDEEPKILERLRRGEHVDHFETVRQRKDGSPVEISLTISPIRNQQGRIIGASKIARDIAERKRLEEQLLLVNRELHHRVKNTLATVQAVVASTARRAQTIAEFQQAVTERITSLAKTHTLLIEKEHGGASIQDILNAELAPYDDGTGGRVRLTGPDVRLPTEMAVAFGMAVHELTTNAAKYGGLSLPSGRIEVTWSLEAQAGRRRLNLAWQEQGGPTVEEPKRQGFGSVLLHRALGRQLGGEVETTFAPDGLQVRISAGLPAL